ncbi:SH3 domain-containing protein [Notoacmeibacter ruber]|uniref:SH3b domain-containing protein n=1 Tax=Notoacmeibacter ruber TaxID=2670375 RepID=A0A3L7J8T6_9HYPH|nr:SH3 domain-containing protein [Notoacmeibacter ruber]RLQ86940.1 hypothetical protein D8780_00685 [Notoacmeibacter ruber]
MATAGRVLFSAVFFLMNFAAVSHAAELSVQARAGMNMRAGPGVQYERVGSMAENASGRLLECTPQGRWCRVEAATGTGWIAGAFLILQDGDLSGSRVRDVASRISFTPDDKKRKRDASTPTAVPGSDPGNTAAGAPKSELGVCFYSEYEEAGEADCHDRADEAITLGREWNDRIASARIGDGYIVTVCDNYGLTGRCQTFRKSIDRMPAALNGRISSWRIEKEG